MKTHLLLASLALAAMSANAQVDVTPARYIFANQPVGQYKLDNVGNCDGGTGANPLPNWPKVVSEWNDGYFIVNNGQMTSLTSPNTANLQSGLNIVDLGGEVGKVLAMKGHDSTTETATAAEGNLTVGWFNLGWYLQQGTCPEKTPVRFQVVFKIYENTPDITTGQLRFDSYTYSNNHCSQNTENAIDKATTNKIWGSADFIARYADDGSPMENEDGDMYYDDELWQQVEFDWVANSEDGDADPLRLTMHFNNNKFNTSTILIKSIKAIQAPEGESVCQPVRYTVSPEAISQLLGHQNATASYDLSGRVVKNTTHGIYIQAGRKQIK